MLRIGIIGCGKIAEKHLNAYKKMEGIEITVSDVVEKGEIIARNYGVNWSDNPDRLIQGNKIDVVDVCIPTPSHGEVILKALEYDKHVFCEKPFTRNFREAKEVEKKAAQTNKIVMIGYLYRFHPALEFSREIIKERIIGEPYWAIFRLGGRGSHKAWKHKRKTGGGASNEMLVHMLDLVLWFFDEIKEVKNLYTDIILKEREIEGEKIEVDAEDVILLKLEIKGGATVLCESDLITPSYMNYIEIQGTNGSLLTSILDYFPVIVYCKEPRGVYDRGNNFFKFPKVDLFEKELSHFIESIKDNKEPEMNSVEDSVKIMKIIDELRIEVVK
ncbi:MAG: Gfo/Idh/MocA family protein [Candidatus Hodarchaeota archaeon]